MLAFAPLDAAVHAASTIVSTFAVAVQPLAGTAATAVAIVGFTIAVRMLISPLTWAQVRGERRRAALAPRVGQLRRRYADDPAKLQAETFALYRAEGASPIAGCLPALLQAPFFFVMYRLFAGPSGVDGMLLGVPLGQHLSGGLAGAAGPLFGVLIALLVGLAWVSSRRMRRLAAAAPAMPAPAGGEPAPAAALLARVTPLLPYGTVLVATVLPLAAVLYLVTTTAWTVLERVVLR
jgi:YidC/Oxa1 family membrane protein insertase